jgi:SAM-dependent methyltransferase
VSQPLAHDLDAMAGAEAYNTWIVDRARPWIRGRVLDAGAGIGTHTKRLRGLADEVVALEPEPELAALLRQQADGLTIVEGDAHAVEGPFDAIVCFNVLEHIADDEGALQRFRELLAPGGRLLLLVPAHPTLFGSLDRAFGHQRRYSKPELETRLVRSGFEIEQLRHVNPVGAVGWLAQARVLRAEHLPRTGLAVYDRIVPLLRAAERVPVPFGLSLWAVAKTTGTASASTRNA